MQRSRAWFLTENANITVTQLTISDECNAGGVKYAIMCKEIAPETGHVHAHLYIYYNNAHTFKSIKNKYPTADIEKAMGTPDQAGKYIEKDGEILFEYGSRPSFKKIDQQWEDAVQSFKEGRGDRETKMYARYQKFFDNLELSARPDERYEGDLSQKNIWIYGDAGVGKSRKVREMADADHAQIFDKPLNKWWDGYEKQGYVVIEDIDRDNARFLVGLIKKWSDRYPFTAETKGGNRRVFPVDYKLIITSNYSINEVFERDQDVEAITRRFHIEHMIPFKQLTKHNRGPSNI